MITFYQFPPALGIPNASPFCLKLETWLRMSGLAYETKIMADPRKAPLGKLPMIEYDGQVVADSSCAIAHLSKACGVKMNAQLNSVERGNAHALTRMLEEHTYWALLYFRWLDDAGWEQTRAAFFANMGGIAKAIVPNLMRRKVRRDAAGHGLSLHSHDEILIRFNTDMNALAACLGEKPYFGGYQPANIDATAYGFLANILHSEAHSPLTDVAKQHANLVQYTARMRDRYFPEFR